MSTLDLINEISGVPVFNEENKRRAKIIQDAQSYTGMSKFPKEREMLLLISENINNTALSEKSSIANILAGLGIQKTLLEMVIGKLKDEYSKEGKLINQKIKNTQQ
jgi:hypothetical protein